MRMLEGEEQEGRLCEGLPWTGRVRKLHREMRECDERRLVSLALAMADVIDRYQRHMKPREADKARQARMLVKIINKENLKSKIKKRNESILRSEGKV